MGCGASSRKEDEVVVPSETAVVPPATIAAASPAQSRIDVDVDGFAPVSHPTSSQGARESSGWHHDRPGSIAGGEEVATGADKGTERPRSAKQSLHDATDHAKYVQETASYEGGLDEQGSGEEPDLLKDLLSRGATPDAVIDRWGLSAFHAACLRGHGNVVQPMLPFVRDINATDHYGRTACNIASRRLVTQLEKIGSQGTGQQKLNKSRSAGDPRRFMNLIDRTTSENQGFSASAGSRSGRFKHLLEQRRRIQEGLPDQQAAERSDGIQKGARTSDGVYIRPGNVQSCQLEDVVSALKEAGADMAKGDARKVRTAPVVEEKLVNGEAQWRTVPGPGASLAERKNARKAIEEGEGWEAVTEGSAASCMRRCLEQFACPWEACMGKGGLGLAEVVAVHRKWEAMEALEPTRRDGQGGTLLHYAAGHADAKDVEILLELKFDPGAVDWRGRDALHHASCRGNMEVLTKLLEHAPALAKRKDCAGRTALHLFDFAKSGKANMEVLKKLAVSSDCARDVHGQTAGHRCAAGGGSDSFRCLRKNLKGFHAFMLEAPPSAAVWSDEAGWAGRGAAREKARGRRMKLELQSQKRRRGEGEDLREIAAPVTEDTNSALMSTRRSALEIALVAGNWDVVTAIADKHKNECPPVLYEEERFPASARARLAEVLCSKWRVSHLIPASVPRAALTFLFGEGRRWPAFPAEEVLAAMEEQRHLAHAVVGSRVVEDARVGGQTLLSFLCESDDRGMWWGAVEEGGREARLLPAVRRLLAAKSSPHPSGGRGAPPLIKACVRGRVSIAAALLEYGAKVDVREKGALRGLWQRRAVSEEAGEEDEDEDEEDEEDEDGDGEGWMRGEHVEDSGLEAWGGEEQQEPGGEVDEPDAKALKRARAQKARADRLVAGADMEWSAEVTAVVACVLAGELDGLEFLLEHGADCSVGAVLKSSGADASALHVLLRVRGELGREGEKQGRWGAVGRRMVELGAREREDSEGESTLALAVRKGYREAAEALAEEMRGEGRGMRGGVLEAVRRGEAGLVERLLQCGAEVQFECRGVARDCRFGESKDVSALQLAVLLGRYDCAAVLCAHAARIAEGDEDVGATARAVVRELSLMSVGENEFFQQRVRQRHAGCWTSECRQCWWRHRRELRRVVGAEDRVCAKGKKAGGEKGKKGKKGSGGRAASWALLCRAGVAMSEAQLKAVLARQRAMLEACAQVRRGRGLGTGMLQRLTTAGRAALRSACGSFLGDALREAAAASSCGVAPLSVELSAIAIALTAADSVLTEWQPGAKDSGAASGALTFGCVTGNLHLAKVAAEVHPAGEIKLDVSGAPDQAVLAGSPVLRGCAHEGMVQGLCSVSHVAIAAMHRQLRVLEMLVEGGADCSVGAVMAAGGSLSALHVLLWYAPVLQDAEGSAEEARWRVVGRRMVELGAREREDSEGESTLALAVRKGYREAAEALAEEMRGEGRGMRGGVLEAVRRGEAGLVERLLQCGAEVSVDTREEVTRANVVTASVYEFVRRRRGVGAGAAAAVVELVRCMGGRLDQQEALALCCAWGAEYQFLDAWKGMSGGEKEAATAHVDSGGRTLMMNAVQGGSVGITRAILEAGSASAWKVSQVTVGEHRLAWRTGGRVDFRCTKEMHPLLLAVDLGREEVALLLAAAWGDSLDSLPRSSWMAGRTLLHIAAARGMTRLVRTLLEGGKFGHVELLPAVAGSNGARVDDEDDGDVAKTVAEETVPSILECCTIVFNPECIAAVLEHTRGIPAGSQAPATAATRIDGIESWCYRNVLAPCFRDAPAAFQWFCFQKSPPGSEKEGEDEEQSRQEVMDCLSEEGLMQGATRFTIPSRMPALDETLLRRLQAASPEPNPRSDAWEWAWTIKCGHSRAFAVLVQDAAVPIETRCAYYTAAILGGRDAEASLLLEHPLLREFMKAGAMERDSRSEAWESVRETTVPAIKNGCTASALLMLKLLGREAFDEASDVPTASSELLLLAMTNHQKEIVQLLASLNLPLDQQLKPLCDEWAALKDDAQIFWVGREAQWADLVGAIYGEMPEVVKKEKDSSDSEDEGDDESEDEGHGGGPVEHEHPWVDVVAPPENPNAARQATESSSRWLTEYRHRFSPAEGSWEDAIRSCRPPRAVPAGGVTRLQGDFASGSSDVDISHRLVTAGRLSGVEELQGAEWVPGAVDLTCNSLGDPGVERLVSLGVFRSLQRVSLVGNYLRPQAGAVLAAHLPPAMAALDLDHNLLGDRGVQALCGALATHAPLAFFSVCENDVREAGAAALASVLRSCRQLGHLGFANRAMGDGGLGEVAAAVVQQAKAQGGLRTIRPDSADWDVAELAAGKELRVERGSATVVPFLAQVVSRREGLERLALVECDLRDEGVGRVCAALSSSNPLLRDLELRQVGLSVKGLPAVAGSVASLKQLSRLDLSRNRLLHAAKVRDAKSGKKQTVARDAVGRGGVAKFMASLLGGSGAPWLQAVELAGVGLDSLEIEALADAISAGPMAELRELDLSECESQPPASESGKKPRLEEGEEGPPESEDAGRKREMEGDVERDLSEAEQRAFEKLAGALSSPRFPKLRKLVLDRELDLGAMRSAQVVDLHGQKLSARDMLLAGPVIASNTAVTELNLSTYSAGKVRACLGPIRSQSLQTLVVSKHMDRESLETDSIPIGALASAEEVDLRKQRETAAIEIAFEVLARNTKLRVLRIANFEEMEEAGNAVYAALMQTTSLTQLNQTVIHPTETDKLDLKSYIHGRQSWRNSNRKTRTKLRTESSDAKLAFVTVALARCSNLKDLDLSGNKLGTASSSSAKWIPELARSVACGPTALTHLNLEDSAWNETSIGPWIEACECQSALTSLNLSRNAELSDAIAAVLSRGPRTMARLQTLGLKSCGISSLSFISESLQLNSVLRALDVSENKFKSGDGDALGSFVKLHTTLTSLCLESNPLGDEGIASLGSNLVLCTGLQSLELAKTANSHDGTRGMVPAIVMLTCLTRLNSLKLPHSQDESSTEGWRISFDAGTRNAEAVWGRCQMLLLARRLSELDPAALSKVELLKNPEVPKTLDLKGCKLDHLPPGVPLLTQLSMLDVSNNELERLPVQELCAMPYLKSLSCARNPRLFSPPPEISGQSAQATMDYLRQAVESGHASTSMLLLAIGDGESGKTSTINALLSDADVSHRIHEDSRTVGIDIREWTPAIEQELTFRIMDLAGQAVYSLSHQFFLVRRGIYVLVWRASEPSAGPGDGATRRLKRMVLHWMDSLQLRVPGATMVLVVTHIDCAGSEANLTVQTDFVKSVVQRKLRELEEKSAHFNVLPLRVLCGGESFRVNCLKGEGIAELRSSVIDLTLSLPWYAEQIPKTYIDLQQLVSRSMVSGRTWMSWVEFAEGAQTCGLDDVHLPIATLFLHEIGTIKYFGDVRKVMESVAAWHPPLRWLDTLDDTVFISSFWIIDALKGLLRHDREALMAYFGGDHVPEKSRWLRRVHRLSTFGIMHDELVPYMWPSDERSAQFWEWARTHDREGSLWDKDVAKGRADYGRVVALLQGCDIIHRIGEDEHVVPALLSQNQQRKVDARAYEDLSSPCGLTAEYDALPPGFFERVVVRCRRTATHMDFTPTSAVFYWRGLKAQLFLVRETREDTGPAKIAMLASSSRQLHVMDANVRHIENFFPGLQRVNEETQNSQKEPTQALFACSGASLPAMTAMRGIAQLMVSIDTQIQLAEVGRSTALNVDRENPELLWVFDAVEAKLEVVVKEAFRRVEPLLHTLAQLGSSVSGLMAGWAALDSMHDKTAFKLSPWARPEDGEAMCAWLRRCRSELSPALAELDSIHKSGAVDARSRLRRFGASCAALANAASVFRREGLQLSEDDKAVAAAVLARLQSVEQAHAATAGVKAVVREMLADAGEVESGEGAARAAAAVKELLSAASNIVGSLEGIHARWFDDNLRHTMEAKKRELADAKVAPLEEAVRTLEEKFEQARSRLRELQSEAKELGAAAEECRQTHLAELKQLNEWRGKMESLIGDQKRLASDARSSGAVMNRLDATAVEAIALVLGKNPEDISPFPEGSGEGKLSLEDAIVELKKLHTGTAFYSYVSEWDKETLNALREVLREEAGEEDEHADSDSEGEEVVSKAKGKKGKKGKKGAASQSSRRKSTFARAISEWLEILSMYQGVLRDQRAVKDALATLDSHHKVSTQEKQAKKLHADALRALVEAREACVRKQLAVEKALEELQDGNRRRLILDQRVRVRKAAPMACAYEVLALKPGIHRHMEGRPAVDSKPVAVLDRLQLLEVEEALARKTPDRPAEWRVELAATRSVATAASEGTPGSVEVHSHAPVEVDLFGVGAGRLVAEKQVQATEDPKDAQNTAAAFAETYRIPVQGGLGMRFIQACGQLQLWAHRVAESSRGVAAEGGGSAWSVAAAALCDAPAPEYAFALRRSVEALSDERERLQAMTSEVLVKMAKEDEADGGNEEVMGVVCALRRLAQLPVAATALLEAAEAVAKAVEAVEGRVKHLEGLLGRVSADGNAEGASLDALDALRHELSPTSLPWWGSEPAVEAAAGALHAAVEQNAEVKLAMKTAGGRAWGGGEGARVAAETVAEVAAVAEDASCEARLSQGRRVPAALRDLLREERVRWAKRADGARRVEEMEAGEVAARLFARVVWRAVDEAAMGPAAELAKAAETEARLEAMLQKAAAKAKSDEEAQRKVQAEAKERAAQALEALRVEDVSELKASATPPPVVEQTAQWVGVLTGIADNSWEGLKGAMGDPKAFIKTLSSCSAELTDKRVDLVLEGVRANPDLSPPQVAQESAAGAAMLRWVVATAQAYDAARSFRKEAREGDAQQQELAADLERVRERKRMLLEGRNPGAAQALAALELMMDHGRCPAGKSMPADVLEGILRQRIPERVRARSAPTLKEAREAVKALTRKDIAEIRAFGNPPRLVMMTLTAVAVLFGHTSTWADVKKMLGDSQFLTKLYEFDPLTITRSQLRKVTQMLDDPDLDQKKLRNISHATSTSCLWARSMLSCRQMLDTEEEETEARVKTLASEFGEEISLQQLLGVLSDGSSSSSDEAGPGSKLGGAAASAVEEALRVDAAFLERLHSEADAPHCKASRLSRLLELAPSPEEAQVARQELHRLSLLSIPDLVARKNDEKVVQMILERFSWVQPALEGTEQADAAGEETPSDIRVVVLGVDASLGTDPAMVATLKHHVAKRRAIIPVILPGYKITDYSKWWPPSMPELARHALFVDLRQRPLWRDKITFELLPQVNKFLEEWRGEMVDAEALKQVLSRVPCHHCMSSGVQEVSYFDRDEATSVMEAWRKEHLRTLAEAADAEERAAATATATTTTETMLKTTTTVAAQSEDALAMQCGQGHSMRVVDVLSKAVIYDAVPCPQCVHDGVVPPFCFNRRHCLLYFDEENSGRVGAVECAKCLAAGRPASIRILDIIAPEVFLSYNWGAERKSAAGAKEYSTQALVKPLQQRVEREEDVVCWFDVGGGMGAGQDLKTEMEEGVRKCTVVVVFLSDSYVNSANCQREFAHATRLCKFIIPVLVPDGGSTRFGSSGWSGPGGDDAKWWAHAIKVCARNSHPDTGAPLPWSMLQHFSPVDMRADGQTLPGSAAELEIRRRIASRFHRGDHIVHKTEASYARWRRTRAKVRHALANRRAGKTSALFPATGAAQAEPALTRDETATSR